MRKLRSADQKVLWASRVLTGDQKLLALDTAALDSGPPATPTSAPPTRRGAWG